MTTDDDLVARIAAIPGRVAGSDAERRAARLLARELRRAGRRPRVQTVWVRPSWAPVLAVICGLAVLGTAVSVDHPNTGLGLCAAALVLFLGDISGRLPLLRRLTVARATQNVVAVDDHEAPVRLVVTAATDTPRVGVLGRGLAARVGAALVRTLGVAAPGGFGLVLAALMLATAAAGARALEVDDSWLGLMQLVPVAVLIVTVGAVLDQWAADVGPGANADGSACATALALVAALDERPPRNLAVDIVLAGAGGAHALGMRRWAAAQRRAGRLAEEIVVLHVAPCGAGRPVWWTREGLVLPLAYHPRLTAIAADVAAAEQHLQARPVQGRGATGARAARALGWPAIAVGCLDEHDQVPRSGDMTDVAAQVDRDAMAACLTLALGLVRALDRELGEARAA